mgnify:CR=1 FL=1
MKPIFDLPQPIQELKTNFVFPFLPSEGSGQLAGEVKKYVPDPSLVVGVNSYNGSIMTPAQIAAALK